jgi:hypothetical protein
MISPANPAGALLDERAFVCGELRLPAQHRRVDEEGQAGKPADVLNDISILENGHNLIAVMQGGVIEAGVLAQPASL